MKEVEQDFVQFLAFNSAPNWEEIKRKDPARAKDLLEEFSDLIFEKTVHNTEFLEKRSKDTLEILQVKRDKISSCIIQCLSENIDLNKEKNINNKLQDLADKGKLIIYRTSITLDDDPRKAIFQKLEMGYNISSKKLHDQVQQLRVRESSL